MKELNTAPDGRGGPMVHEDAKQRETIREMNSGRRMGRWVGRRVNTQMGRWVGRQVGRWMDR